MSGPWIGALSVGCYLTSLHGVFWLIALNPPSWLETLLSVFAAPGVFALLLWRPLLRPLGLTGGDMINIPTLLGFALLLIFYCALAYGVVALFARLQAK